MKMKHLVFLFIIPLCCFGERDYKMVDLRNGLTSELLAVGPTSIIISIEWPLDMRPYGDVAWFGLMGKTNIEERGWYHLIDINTDQPQGKVIREIPYDNEFWLNFGKSLKAEKKKFGSLSVCQPQQMR